MTERKDERDAKQDARKDERREGRPEHEINRPENPIVEPPEAEQLPTEKPWRDREPDPEGEVPPEEVVEEE